MRHAVLAAAACLVSLAIPAAAQRCAGRVEILRPGLTLRYVATMSSGVETVPESGGHVLATGELLRQRDEILAVFPDSTVERSRWTAFTTDASGVDSDLLSTLFEASDPGSAQCQEPALLPAPNGLIWVMHSLPHPPRDPDIDELWILEGLPSTNAARPGDIVPGLLDPSTNPPTLHAGGDGVIDIADVVALMRASVGLTQIEP